VIILLKVGLIKYYYYNYDSILDRHNKMMKIRSFNRCKLNDNIITHLKLENPYLKTTLKTFQNKIVPIMVIFTIYTIIFSSIFIFMIITYKK
jgi:hypothetical protein